jgi:hypothetical protein
MYEGLSTPYKEKRKRLSPTKIVILALAALLVVSAVGYYIFWRTRISAPFGKFYGEDYGLSLFMTGKSPTGYVVNVVEPFVLEIGVTIGYVSIETIDQKYQVWFNLDALTDEIVDWIVSIEIEPLEYNGGVWYRGVGFQVDKNWRAYTYPPDISGFNKDGKSPEGKTAQEYADEHRAEIQKLFDEIERRWGYKFPPESSGLYDS